MSLLKWFQENFIDEYTDEIYFLQDSIHIQNEENTTQL